MTDFERAVLAVLARAGEPLGSYQIERRPSTMTLAERPNLLDVLADLCGRGLVEQVAVAIEPKVRHTVTPAGTAALGIMP
jgi:uncharacterized protein YqfA (UPF0365 family)